MAQNFHVRKPVATLSNANASTSIPTGSWLALTTSLANAAAHLTAFNSGAAPVQIATGLGGAEKVLCIVGINESLSIPVEIKKGERISAQVVGAAANATGFTTLNFLG